MGPLPATAQNDVDGHDTAFSVEGELGGIAIGVTLVLFQALLGPVGLVEVNAFPAKSTATHRLDVGQEMPENPRGAMAVDCSSTCTAFQAGAPPVGSVELRTLPS